MLPRYKDVQTLHSRVYTSLAPFHTDNYSLRTAYDLTVGDQWLLRDDLAQGIVTLYDLVRQDFLVPVAEM